MLPKKHRLHPVLDQVFIKPNQKISTQFFILIYKNSQSNVFKFAVTISKKVAKSAVDRNYCRRLISNHIYQKLELTQLTQGFNCLIMVKQWQKPIYEDFLLFLDTELKQIFNLKTKT